MSLFLPILRTKSCPSHWPLFQITIIVESMDSVERETNPVGMTVINPRKA